jgi:hypothetical protein
MPLASQMPSSTTIATLLFLGNALPEGFKICRPKGSTKDQAARIIVNYMQSHPEDSKLPNVICTISSFPEVMV